MLRYLTLPAGSIIAIDRAYIDYSVFQRFTEQSITYVTKMKKNLTYTTLHSEDVVTPDGVKYHISKVVFSPLSEHTHFYRTAIVFFRIALVLDIFCISLISLFRYPPQRD